MRFEYKDLGFAFELSDYWQQGLAVNPVWPNTTFFDCPHGKLLITPGEIRDDLVEKGTRKVVLEQDFRRAGYTDITWCPGEKRLGAETNVLVAHYNIGLRKGCAISAVHGILDIEICFEGDSGEFLDEELNNLMAGFEFFSSGLDVRPERLDRSVSRSPLLDVLLAQASVEKRRILSEAGAPPLASDRGYSTHDISRLTGAKLPEVQRSKKKRWAEWGQSQEDNWATLVRRFLTNRDTRLLDQAIKALQREMFFGAAKRQSFFQRLFGGLTPRDSLNLRTLILLEAWQRADFQKVVNEAPSLVHKLRAQEREEASLTIALLHYEILIQTAEGHITLPVSRQAQVFQTGLDACRSCAQIARKLGDIPCIASYLVRLGNGLYSARKLTESVEVFEEALSIWRALATEQPEQYLLQVARTLHHLGDVWNGCEELNKARSAYEESLAILRGASQAGSRPHQLELAQVLNNLGGLYQSTNQLETALEMFEESLSIYQSLTSSEELNGLTSPMISSRPPIELDMSRVLCSLANTLCGLDDLQKARAAFEQAASIQRRLVPQGPKVVLLQLAKSLIGLGGTLYELGLMAHPAEIFDRDEVLFKEARRALEEALAIYRQHSLEHAPTELRFKVVALHNLGKLLGSLGETAEARQLLEEAIEICRRHEFWRLLAGSLHARAAIEAWASHDHLAGFIYDEQAVKSVEKGLAQLSTLERVNRSLFKGEIEVSYAVCIAHYAERHDPKRVFHFLESLCHVDRLSDPSLERPVSIENPDLDTAREVVAQHNVAYLAIQVVPGRAIFLAVLPSGKIELCSIGKEWRAKFSGLFTLIDQTMQDISQEHGQESLLDKLGKGTDSLVALGSELFDMLPDEVKTLFTSEIRYVFLSPHGGLQNLPFEFLYLPTGEWLGLRRLLPRVYSFAELQSVLYRQPDRRSRSSVIVGDSRNNLPYAREAATYVAAKLQAHGFDLAPDGEPLLGDTATDWRFLDGLDSQIVLGLYCGHGGYDNKGGFLALAGEEKVRPSHVAHLSLTNQPIMHYDCCRAGVATYHWGGEYGGFGYFTIARGASCCLLANRFLFDELAARMSKLFYAKLLEEAETTGVALLETRNQLAKDYLSPLSWAFPVLYGNPDARLIEPTRGG